MLKIGQIGVGYWGPNLLRNLVACRKCRVPFVTDISSERREYVRGLYPGIRVTDDVNELIGDNDVDAVVVATPVVTHFDIAVRALKAGKHILVEKPLATSMKEVEQIGELARERNRVVMAGHTFLFNPAVRYVKKLIDSGEIGDIRYIYSQRLNLGRIRSDVDALWNFAPHDVSIIQYWLGDPEPISVVRRGADYIQEKIDDVVFLNIIYPNKVLVNIHVSWLDPQKTRSMTIVGSKKMVIYNDTVENKIVIYDKGIDRKAESGGKLERGAPDFQPFLYRSGDVLMPMIDFKEPLRVEIEHFIDCIENGTKCLSGLDHAMKVVRILANGENKSYARVS